MGISLPWSNLVSNPVRQAHCKPSAIPVLVIVHTSEPHAVPYLVVLLASCVAEYCRKQTFLDSVAVSMAVKPTHLGKAGKRVLNDQFFKKAKVISVPTQLKLSKKHSANALSHNEFEYRLKDTWQDPLSSFRSYNKSTSLSHQACQQQLLAKTAYKMSTGSTSFDCGGTMCRLQSIGSWLQPRSLATGRLQVPGTQTQGWHGAWD